MDWAGKTLQTKHHFCHSVWFLCFFHSIWKMFHHDPQKKPQRYHENCIQPVEQRISKICAGGGWRQDIMEWSIKIVYWAWCTPSCTEKQTGNARYCWTDEFLDFFWHQSKTFYASCLWCSTLYCTIPRSRSTGNYTLSDIVFRWFEEVERHSTLQ